MSRHIGNINLIFWGLLIVLIDFSFSATTNGFGYRFDILNDLAGSIMIFKGLYNISQIGLIDPSFSSQIRVCLIISLIHTLYSISSFFTYPTTGFVDFLLELFDLVFIWGQINFAGAMIVLAVESSLSESLTRWIKTRKLLLQICFYPAVILTVFSGISSLFKGSSVKLSFDQGWIVAVGATVVILLTIIYLIPFFYGMYTIHLMKQEIRQKY